MNTELVSLASFDVDKASNITPTIPEYVIHSICQIGCGTLIQGEPGCGKTALTIALAAAVSSGHSILDMPVLIPGPVVIVSNEDNPGTIRTMLEANGADLDMCYIVKAPAGLELGSAHFEALLAQYRPTLVIFHPLQSYLGARINMDKANETRPVLGATLEMAQKYQCALVFIAHTGKTKSDKNMVYQSLGSVDIPGAMRDVFHVRPCKDRPGQTEMVHAKSNSGPLQPPLIYQVGAKRKVNFLGYDGEPKTLPEDDYLYVTIDALINKYDCEFYSYEELQDASLTVTGTSVISIDLMRRKLAGGIGVLFRRNGIIIETDVERNGRTGVRITYAE